MVPLIVAPEIRQDEALWRYCEVFYKQWRIEYDLAHPAPPIENVRFAHDPDWRNNAFSIQNAHDHKHWVWKATYVAFMASQVITWVI